MANIDVSTKLKIPVPLELKTIVTSLDPAVNGVVYSYDLTSGPYTLTLPAGTFAAVIGVLNKNGSASETLYLDVAPGSGGTIRGSVDTYRFRYPNFSAYLYREEGSSDWQVDLDIATMSNIPGSVPGYVGGTNISSGYIGEKITWATPPTTQTSTTTLSDWTNAFITLTPGVWMVVANVVATVVTGTTAGNGTANKVSITDSANTLINLWERRISVTTPAAAACTLWGVIAFAGIVNISATTVYKLRIQLQNLVGTGSGDIRNATSDSSEFYAIRVA